MNGADPVGDAGRVLDLTGYRCPIPVIRAEAALRAATPGSRLLILADDPIAAVDLPHFLGEAGYAFSAVSDPRAPLALSVSKPNPRK
ncbi:MAG: sulfurtransferase TusA family protein [Pseudomonadota bacterium]